MLYSDLIAVRRRWSISGDAEVGQGTGKGMWLRPELSVRSGSQQGHGVTAGT